MSELNHQGDTLVDPADYARDIKLLNAFLAKMEPRLSSHVAMHDEGSRQLVDEIIHLYCGPEGVATPSTTTARDRISRAWFLVGSFIQDAMDSITVGKST